MEDLKKQVIADLNKNNEQERLKRVEENSKLKEINFYSNPKNPTSVTLKTTFDKEGIKYKEINVTLPENKTLFNSVVSTVQLNAIPVIQVNGNYLVFRRDFMNSKQCINIIKHIAHPDYINPSFEERMIESMKTFSHNTLTHLGQIKKQLQPIVKIMNELAKEENEEKNN